MKPRRQSESHWRRPSLRRSAQKMKRLPFINSCLIFLALFFLLRGLISMFVAMPLQQIAVQTGMGFLHSLAQWFEYYGSYPVAAVVSALLIAPLYHRFYTKEKKFQYAVFVVGLVLVTLQLGVHVSTQPVVLQ